MRGSILRYPTNIPGCITIVYVVLLRNAETLLAQSKKMGVKFFLLLVSLVTINSALSAKIAGFSGLSSGSHYLLMKKVMEELAARGHEVGECFCSRDRNRIRIGTLVTRNLCGTSGTVPKLDLPFHRSRFGSVLNRIRIVPVPEWSAPSSVRRHKICKTINITQKLKAINRRKQYPTVQRKLTPEYNTFHCFANSVFYPM